MFGQRSFFGEPEDDASTALRFRVSAAGRRQGSTTNLALAVARARAAAADGHRVVIVAVDGSAAVVSRSSSGGFVVVPFGSGVWPDQCRRLLDEHG